MYIYTYIIDIRPSILLKTFFTMCYIYMDRYVYIHICHRHVRPSTLQKISITVWESLKRVLILFAYSFTHPFSTYSFSVSSMPSDKVQAH